MKIEWCPICKGTGRVGLQDESECEVCLGRKKVKVKEKKGSATWGKVHDTTVEVNP